MDNNLNSFRFAHIRQRAGTNMSWLRQLQMQHVQLLYAQKADVLTEIIG